MRTCWTNLRASSQLILGEGTLRILRTQSICHPSPSIPGPTCVPRTGVNSVGQNSPGWKREGTFYIPISLYQPNKTKKITKKRAASDLREVSACLPFYRPHHL